METNLSNLESTLKSFSSFDKAVIKTQENFNTLVALIDPSYWVEIFSYLKQEGFDYLTFLAGIDLSLPTYEIDPAMPVLPEKLEPTVCQGATRFQVFAILGKVGHGKTQTIVLKTDVLEDEMTVDSIVNIFPGADWHERECWEMFGINFKGHDEMRHLYLPYEFEGNPLRKEFQLLPRKIKTWPGLNDVEPMR